MWGRKKKRTNTIKTPKSWLPTTPKRTSKRKTVKSRKKRNIKTQVMPPKPTPSSQNSMIEFEVKQTRKWHVPGLRQGKRVVAAVLLAINFFISQAALTGPSDSQSIALLFLFNAFILIDYIWKTRNKPSIEEFTT